MSKQDAELIPIRKILSAGSKYMGFMKMWAVTSNQERYPVHAADQ